MTKFLVVIFLFIGAPVSLAASFTSIGFLPGASQTEATAISTDGSSVVGRGRSSTTSPFGWEAFRWRADTGIVGLGDLPGSAFTSQAVGVSGDGNVVTGQGQTDSIFPALGATQAFRWTSGGMTSLGSLPGGAQDSRGLDVSANGEVIVGHSDTASSTQVAFRWTAADGMVDIQTGSIFNASSALGTNDDGSVVVGQAIETPSSIPGVSEAFRWTAADGMVGLGDFVGGRDVSIATDVSVDGSVIVGVGSTDINSNPGNTAFLWTETSGLVALTTDIQSSANSVSADGSVVVGNRSGSDGAFVWTAADGLRNLSAILTENSVDISGWELLSASDVSADGIFVTGFARNPDGAIEAYIADIAPVPLPAGFWLFGSALGLLAWKSKIWRGSRTG